MISLPRIKKPETVNDLGEIQVDDLIEQYSRLGEHIWHQENTIKENNFPCFHHTQHIIFRFIPGLKDPNIFYSNPIWSLFKPTILPILNEISTRMGIKNPEYPKAMLARLQADQRIDPHRDGAGANLYTHKIHIPLQTNPGAIMHIGKSSQHLEQGHAYEVNNLVRHSVENKGKEDRVHLIFEVFDKP